ncbi:MAG: hypothetical protein NQ127_01140 [Candidatus Cardinium sp.]|nr:hypothetical protein [Candidatus Cardinium sp.]
MLQKVYVPTGWEKIYKKIGNRLSEQAYTTACKAFEASVQQEIDNTKFQEFVYLEEIGNADDRDGFNEAVKNSTLYNSAIIPVIFRSINELFENRTGNELTWMFGIFIFCIIVYAIVILFVRLNETAVVNFQKGGKIKDPLVEEGLDFFLMPRKVFL